jgi:hypothetical protein
MPGATTHAPAASTAKDFLLLFLPKKNNLLFLTKKQQKNFYLRCFGAETGALYQTRHGSVMGSRSGPGAGAAVDEKRTVRCIF